MFYFHLIRTKDPPIFYFPPLGPANYFHKIPTTAGPSCSEVGMKFSKQELSCFVEFRHELIGLQPLVKQRHGVFTDLSYRGQICHILSLVYPDCIHIK